jgi:hypothetical protein
MSKINFNGFSGTMMLSASINGLSSNEICGLFNSILNRAIKTDEELLDLIQSSELVRKLYNALRDEKPQPE